MLFVSFQFVREYM